MMRTYRLMRLRRNLLENGGSNLRESVWLGLRSPLLILASHCQITWTSYLQLGQLNNTFLPFGPSELLGAYHSSLD